MKEKTGLKYADGSDICDGDNIVLWHEVSFQKQLFPYTRFVQWSDYHAGYIAVCNKQGYQQHLSRSIYDVNCRKVTKYVDAKSILDVL